MINTNFPALSLPIFNREINLIEDYINKQTAKASGPKTILSSPGSRVTRSRINWVKISGLWWVDRDMTPAWNFGSIRRPLIEYNTSLVGCVYTITIITVVYFPEIIYKPNNLNIRMSVWVEIRYLYMRYT